MFGTYPFGAPYWGQAPDIDVDSLEHLDAGDASIRTLSPRNTVRELNCRQTVRALRARETVKEMPPQ